MQYSDTIAYTEGISDTDIDTDTHAIWGAGIQIQIQCAFKNKWNGMNKY